MLLAYVLHISCPFYPSLFFFPEQSTSELHVSELTTFLHLTSRSRTTPQAHTLKHADTCPSAIHSFPTPTVHLNNHQNRRTSIMTTTHHFRMLQHPDIRPLLDSHARGSSSEVSARNGTLGSAAPFPAHRLARHKFQDPSFGVFGTARQLPARHGPGLCPACRRETAMRWKWWILATYIHFDVRQSTNW